MSAWSDRALELNIFRSFSSLWLRSTAQERSYSFTVVVISRPCLPCLQAAESRLAQHWLSKVSYGRHTAVYEAVLRVPPWSCQAPDVLKAHNAQGRAIRLYCSLVLLRYPPIWRNAVYSTVYSICTILYVRGTVDSTVVGLDLLLYYCRVARWYPDPADF